MLTTQRALVTGATGFVGANLVRRLLAHGHDVHALVRRESQRWRLQDLGPNLTFHEARLEDPATVERAFRKADPGVIYHLAATPFNPSTIPDADHATVNMLGTLHVLQAARASNHPRVVIAGTGAEYGAGRGLKEDAPLRPRTVLGATKASASLLAAAFAHVHDLETVVLRLFTPFGPWESPRRLIPQVILSALQGRDFPMSDGNQERDFIFIDDVVDAFVSAGRAVLPPGAAYNIGSGAGTPVRRVVEQTLRLMGDPVRALVGELPTRPDEILQMSADIAAAERDLKWSPRVRLEEGLRRSIAWFRTHQTEVVSVV